MPVFFYIVIVNMEYQISDLYAIDQYNYRQTSIQHPLQNHIGDDVYFYPDKLGQIHTYTKKISSIVPTPIIRTIKQSKNVDIPTTFFLISISLVGMFTLYQLQQKM